MKKYIFILISIYVYNVNAQSLDQNFTMSVVPKEEMSISEVNEIVNISSGSSSTITIDDPRSNENFTASQSITLSPGAHLTPDVLLRISDLTLINESVYRSITYYDGLGRPIQSNAIGQSPNGLDIVNHYEYDQFGRTEKSYLPLPSNQNTGNFISNPVSQINSYYQNTYEDTNPYAQQRFDNSPLSRVLESASPGDDWLLSENSNTNHTSKFETITNTSNEIRRFDIGDSNNLISGLSYYNPNELVKNISKNENWKPTDGKLNTKEVFTDKNGRIITSINYIKDNGVEQKLITQYIYDYKGRLVYMIPPEAYEKIEDVITYEEFNISIPFENFVQNPMQVIAQGDSNFSLQPYNNEGNTVTDYHFGGNVDFQLDDINSESGAFLKLGDIFTLPNGSIIIPDRPLFNIYRPGSNNTIWYEFSLINGTIHNTLRVTNGPDNDPQAAFRVSLINFNFEDLLPARFALNPSNLNDLAFQYKYDKYNRQIGQKMPGKAWQYVVYDQLDRPILTQDYQLRSLNQWMFNKYDALGRTIYSGKFSSSLTQEQSQAQIDNFINNSNNLSNVENRTNTTNIIGGVSINYSNTAFPNTDIIEVTSVNYYDDYNFSDSDKPSIPTNVLGQVVTSKTKGLPTASWSKTIGANTWTKSYPFYDHKTQEIKVYGKNHLSGSNIVETELDFTGNVQKVITTHKRTSSSPSIQTTDRFEYDNAGRLTNQLQKINNQQEERIVEHVYNELGELTNKKIGGTSNNTTALQNIEYKRNIRGWLKQLNNPNQDLGNDLFAFETRYNNANSGITPLYSGTITGVDWKSAINDNLKTYDYQYDNLGRISKATFSSSSVTENNRYNVSNLNYDRNGNITSLSRNGWQNSSSYLDMDNLMYEYNGNQLTKVTDSGNDQYGFKDANNNNTVDYEYDENGNLIRDNHKKFSITYNYLNLPSKVTFDNGEIIDITYNSTGAKLSKTYTSGANTTKTEYLGGFQYTNSQLQFFGQAEGFVYKVGNSYKYAYVYADHLGNNRLSYTDANNNGNIETNEIISNTDYYPFGLTHSGELQASIASEYNYKFQGKEIQQEGGLDHYDFGSRMYDASLGRWFAVDPQGQFSSPYLAMGNNPVMMVDPDGEFSWLATLVGAFVYTAFDAARGNVNNWEDFFTSLGTGAAQSAFAGYESVENAAFGAAYSQFNSVATGDATGDGLTLSFNPTYSWGSNFGGWGLNASINGRLGNFEGSIGYGFTNYGTFDVDKGHRTVSNETRLSYSLGWNDGDTGLRFYTTKFTDGLGKNGGQRVGGLDFTSGKFGFRYENDGFPFQYIGIGSNSLGDGNDSYRTAALQLSYGDFSYGFNLFTGYRDDYSEDSDKLNDRIKANHGRLDVPFNPVFDEEYPHNFVEEEGPKYRLGAQYLAYKGYRVGLNSEKNRHKIQDLRAHDIYLAVKLFGKKLALDTRQPGFIMTHNRKALYFQYNSYNNPYTLW
ncbi:DUF6443 domain-containing protein [Aquimarina sp. Aq107]|uniref:DUF6443 domain-containing protein n=1 Tax=Aquimarina sp. Aq107 TaxID=1191912 RepID=UPI000D5501A5|nr:DUF6443 domain-containing protein [Aquimarina sp. Aq107]